MPYEPLMCMVIAEIVITIIKYENVDPFAECNLKPLTNPRSRPLCAMVQNEGFFIGYKHLKFKNTPQKGNKP